MARYSVKIFLFWCCAFSTFSVASQSLVHDHYGLREGLAARQVNSTLEGPSGYIWLGTAHGLSRFDGYEFDNFLPDNTRSTNSLSHADILSLHLSKQQKLVVIYNNLFSSFDLFDPIDFTVQKIEVALSVTGTPRAFHVTRDGHIFVASFSNSLTIISEFIPASATFKEVCRFREKWTDKRPFIQLAVTKEDRFYLHDTAHGLRYYDRPKDAYQYLEATQQQPQFTRRILNFFHQDQRGRCWLAFREQPGVYELDQSTDSLIQDKSLPINAKYTNVWEDNMGNLLFNEANITGTYPYSFNLWCLNTDGSIAHFPRLVAFSNYILSVSGEDFNHSLMMGSDTGFRIVANTNTRIQRYLSKDIGADQRAYSMRGIVQTAPDEIYFSRELNYWYRLNTTTQVMDTMELRDAYGRHIAFNDCQGIWFDGDRYLWGITGDGTSRWGGMLHRFDVEECYNITYTSPHRFTAYADTIVDSISYLGGQTFDGQNLLLAFDHRSNTFQKMADAEGNYTFIKSIIRYVLPVGQDIWLGTEQGVLRYNLETKTYEQYTRVALPNNPDAQVVNLGSNVIYALFYRNKRLWIGTNNGLSCYNFTTAEWTNIDSKNGALSNTIANILPADSTSLWISTYNGLWYLDYETQNARWFFQSEGLAHDEFNRFSALQTSSGRYYFGGVNGISSFHSNELLESRPIPKAQLTRFTYYDEQADTTMNIIAGLQTKPLLVIEPSYTSFQLDLNLPLYIPRGENIYRYRFSDDPKEDWMYLRNGRSLRYNDLKAGRYLIYVQGADPSGNWSKETLVISMQVIESFYKQSWFIILLVIGSAAGIIFLIRYRSNEKIRMEKLRTQLASDLHDEVSGLLAGISMQTELLRSQVENNQQLDSKLINIREASQRAMSKMNDVIWSIDSRRDRLKDLITRMEEHADEVLLPLNVQYQLRTHQLGNDQSIPANVRQNVYFIFKEAINNIAKHAQAKSVDIWLGNVNNQFIMRIQDDGIGDQHEGENKRKKTGQGIANLKMRAQRLNADLNIKNGQGYTIRLRMKRFT